MRPCIAAFLTEWLCESRDAGRASECQRLEGEDWSRGRACTRRWHRGHSSWRETRNPRRCRNERLSSLHRRGRQTRSRTAVQQAEIVERWKDRHGAAKRAWNKGQVEFGQLGAARNCGGPAEGSGGDGEAGTAPAAPFSPDS